MAKRRMLTIPVVESDMFYDLSAAAQALYMHMNMNADDDGVVDRAKTIVGRMAIKKKVIYELIEGGYIIELEEGLYAITHWHQHNSIKKDRYVEGEYKSKIMGLLISENGRFFKGSATENGDICAPQDRIGKDREAKVSTDKGSVDKAMEAEERKEKILSLFQSNKQASDDKRRRAKNQSDLSSLSSDSSTVDPAYAALKNEIALYFMKKYGTADVSEFIKLCEDRKWEGHNGDSMKTNFRRYADIWMEVKKKAYQNDTPSDSN